MTETEFKSYTFSFFVDRPDPPKHPVCDSVGIDSLALSWYPPEWDGGSSITNYLVEKRELPMTSWIRVGNTRFSSNFSFGEFDVEQQVFNTGNRNRYRFNTMAVTGLTPNHEYEFRVYAENVYGRSDPAISNIVKTKDTGKKKVQKKKYEGTVLTVFC